MPDTSLFLGLWSFFTGGYSVVSGMRTAKSLQRLAVASGERSADLQMRTQNLSDRVSLLEGTFVLRADKYRDVIVGDGRGIDKMVAGSHSLADATESRIYLSNQIRAPSRLPEKVSRAPEKFLIGVRPLSEGSDDISMIELLPVIFDINSKYYVGWQKQDVLSALLEMKIDESGWFEDKLHPGSHSSREITDESVQESASSDEVRIPIIQILNGPKTGVRLPINKPVTTIGRPGVQIGAIVEKPGEWHLMEIETADCVDRITINGKQVDSNPVPLRDCDMLCVAGIVVRFYLPQLS